MAYTVYILKSARTNRYYIGSTEDFEKRLEVHNGPHARWTKRFQPWAIVQREDFASRGEAVERERFLKSLKGVEGHLEKIKGGRS